MAVISNTLFFIFYQKIRYCTILSFKTHPNNKAFKNDHFAFIQELKELLEKNGFEINQNKTRLEYYSSRQEVTGLTVND